jgi:hypothetical protein
LGRVRVSVVEFTNVTGELVHASPYAKRTDWLVKPEPMIVMGVSFDPSPINEGLILVITGAGPRTVSATSSVAGVPADGDNVTLPLWVPGARAVVFTETLSVDSVVVLVTIQGSETLKVKAGPATFTGLRRRRSSALRVLKYEASRRYR